MSETSGTRGTGGTGYAQIIQQGEECCGCRKNCVYLYRIFVSTKHIKLTLLACFFLNCIKKVKFVCFDPSHRLWTLKNT